jgi:formamidopyrimidine-DNA glycosylase
MPELPEAETIARCVADRVVGTRVDRVVHLRRDVVKHGPARAPKWLAGSRIVSVTRRGKRPIILFEGDRGMIVFLGMSGYLDVHDAAAPPRPHTHLRLALDDGSRELRFADARRFGGLSFFEAWNGVVPAGLADLGPEPLEITARQFREILACRRQIKALLMDQHAIAGLGNIYCDEALHRAGIHPKTVAADIDLKRVDALRRAIRNVLRSAIQHEGTTIINYAHPEGPGNFKRRLRVYGREDQPCRTCKTPINREAWAGRSSHFCPSCQVL